MTQHREIELWAGDLSEVLPVEATGPNQWVLHATPFGAQPGDSDEDFLYLGDEIETVTEVDGRERFVRRLRVGYPHHYSWLLTPEQASGSEFASFKDLIEKHGGMWETFARGMLYVHMPEGASLDVRAEFESLVAKAKDT